MLVLMFYASVYLVNLLGDTKRGGYRCRLKYKLGDFKRNM